VNEEKVIATAKATNSGHAYRTALQSHQFSLLADEPVSAGGNNEAPAPGDFLCMSLASCKAITLRMYVQRKQWNAGEISVKVSLVKENDAAGNLVHRFICEVSVTGNLTTEQKQRLLQIEKACPVSKLLVRGAEIVSSIG